MQHRIGRHADVMPISYDQILNKTRTLYSADAAVLNIGCGRDIRDGAINVDSVALPGVDMVVNLGQDQLPFSDEYFDLIICKDILEHVELIASLRELHRVLKHGGRMVISTVHFTSRDTWLDPTHVKGFSVGTFDFFAQGGRNDERDYYFDFHFAEVEQSLIQFRTTLGKGKWLFWDRLVEPIVNHRRAVADLYELTALARLFPAANVVAVLRK